MFLKHGVFVVVVALAAAGCGASGSVRQAASGGGGLDGGAVSKPGECEGLECGYGPMGGWCGTCASGRACSKGKCVVRGGDAGTVVAPDAGGAGDSGEKDAGQAPATDGGVSDTGPADVGRADAGTSADCNRKSCGDDDGAGGRCLGCSGANEICDTVTYTCVCVGDCTGKYCGDDDGCGGRCTGCVNPEAACDTVSWRCEGLCPGGVCGCEPDCSAAWCGWDDGCGGKCTRCPDPRDTCDVATGFCGCLPNCAQKFCGRDDGCGGVCTGCPDPRERCDLVAAQCVCDADCTGKFCAEDDGCGGECTACPGPGEVCIPGLGCCAPDCAGRFCGDDDGCGGRCDGCPGAGQVCDTASWTCCTPDCAGRTCGQADGCGGLCGGCPGPNEWCDPATWQCIACDPTGPDVYSVCEDGDGCRCGLDCVRCEDGCVPMWINDPLARGECLDDCTADPGTCGPGQVCHCWQKAGNTCLNSACFDAGTLSGNFAAKTLNSCNDQPAQTDIGSGNMSYAIAGKSYSWNLFIACHYLSADGSLDLVLVQGVKVCGMQACPDWIAMGAVTADLAIGTMNLGDGKVMVEHDQLTYSGSNLTDYWIRGLGESGSINFTAAGKTGKQPIGGTADVEMIRFDYEVCGGGSGVPCQ
ncbi:MAG: hypothetical protein HY897_02745 [Deltaproteobacteria bacterium]|nr:hypothetical protein [Deltaproteobacteria bacterium]